MPNDTRTGIPNPDQPGHWIVPPWRASADFSAVVEHFIRFVPRNGANTAHLRAYFDGYAAALDAARTEKTPCAVRAQWYANMRDCVARCARHYHDGDTPAADATVSALPVAAPAPAPSRTPGHRRTA